jgi:hypothetical protein
MNCPNPSPAKPLSATTPRTRASTQEIIDLHVKCGRKGVKGGEHEAAKVDVIASDSDRSQ